MLEGGEKSGRLDRVLDRLSSYYEQLADFKTLFFSSIVWPVIQLVLAVIVVGLMIYLPSVLFDPSMEQKDLIGLGLVGERGLAIYTICVAGCLMVLFFAYLLAINGYLAFLGEWIALIPWIGEPYVFLQRRDSCKTWR